jgi:hypothetical protein
MKRFLGFMALATMLVGLAPQSVFADGRHDGRPFHGSFAVTFATTLNTGAESYCGGPVLARTTEAHGNGSSTLGTMSFNLIKGIAGFTAHGCLTLMAANGDVLEATYIGGGGSAPNVRGFVPAFGTLTFTGGTGRFKNASGSATFTSMNSVFYRASSFAGGGPANAPIQGMAFYEIEGTIQRERH